jgi:hypothetical protein
MPTARIRYDSAFLDAAFERYRRQHPARGLIRFCKIAGVLVLLPVSAVLFWTGEAVAASGALLAAIPILLSDRLDRWLARRAVAKSPYLDDDLTIRFGEDGFHATSPKQDVKLRWEVFTRVVHFPDGFLLFQGPKLFNWIPFAALDPAGVKELEGLLLKHIKPHRAVASVRIYLEKAGRGPR